jgi:hypothetical protein
VASARSRHQVEVKMSTPPLSLSTVPPRLAARLGSAANVALDHTDVKWLLSILLAASDAAAGQA